MQRNIKELIKSKASTSESYEEGIEQVVKAFVSKLDTLPGVRNQVRPDLRSIPYPAVLMEVAVIHRQSG